MRCSAQCYLSPQITTYYCPQCGCARCGDPTELGTHASTILCPGCGGLVLPDSCALDSDWSCAGCGLSLAMAAVTELVTRLEFDLDTFSYAASPEEWEALLAR